MTSVGVSSRSRRRPFARRGICCAVLAGSLVLGACASDTNPTTTEAAPSTTVAAQSTSETSVPPTTEAAIGSVVDPAELLLSFGAAWEEADWEAMHTIAGDGVVAVATEWYTDGGSVNVSADNVATVLDNCSSSDDGSTLCELLYLAPEGNALIFSAAYVATESGLAVSELIFGGDAG